MTTSTETTDFLQHLHPDNPWVLVVIDPNRDKGNIKAITAHSVDDVSGFLRQYNERWNCYYSLNPTRAPMSKKPTKADIAAIKFLHADLDPKADETPEAAKARYLSQLETFQPRPTAIIDSGNGIQALWRLEEPIALDGTPADKERIADAEARSKAIMLALGCADTSTFNIDRILRLPGTINIPNATKLKAGRVRCGTRIVLMNGAIAKLTDFPKAPDEPKSKPQSKPREKKEAGLPAELRHMLYLTGDKPAGHETKSHLFWFFLLAALRKGIDENVIVAAVLDEAYSAGSIYAHVQNNGGTENYVRTQLAHAINEAQFSTDERGRAIIQIKDGDIDLHWRAIERALIERNCPVYVRGGKLVAPLWRWERANDGSDKLTLTASFEPYNLTRLADMVAHHAVRFEKYDGRLRLIKNIAPPDDVIQHLLDSKNWMFPSVVGIINSPTMRADGSLITEPGYDATTQLWYKSAEDVVLPPIPEKPTREDACKALGILKELLTGFPFSTPVARSAALAGMMTPVLRGTLPGAVPIFAMVANEARSGKTFLVELIAIIATGHKPVTTAGSDKREEMEKRIETAALAGRPIIHMNNLPNGIAIDSTALAQISTEGIIYIRKLGRHEEGVCDCRATVIYLNGNNIIIAADLVPRTVMCRLDAQMEQPEERIFEFDPIQLVRKERGKYLAAIFTIVRAFKDAGYPHQPHKVVAGFEMWSQLVQQSLIWLGESDPMGEMEDLRGMDLSRQELERLLSVLKKCFQADQTFTTADCERLADKVAGTGPYGTPKYEYPELREVMSVFGKINGSEFGKLITRHRYRICDGWRVEPVRKSKKKGNSYKLVMLEATAGEAPIAQTAEEKPF